MINSLILQSAVLVCCGVAGIFLVSDGIREKSVALTMTGLFIFSLTMYFMVN